MGRIAGVDRAVWWLVGVFLLQCALLLVVATPNWDAAFYYAYARSPLFDGDLDLQNDLLLAYPTAGVDFVNRQLHKNLTETGRVFSPFAIGSSLLYLPVLAVVRLLALSGAAIGLLPPMATGYEWLYLATLAAFSAILGLLAFWLTWRAAGTLAGRSAALPAVLTLMFSTPLLYYQFREPLYAHAAAAFVTALVVVVWLRQQGELPAPAGALLLGGLLGLAVLVRWQHALYLVLPAATVLLAWRRAPGRQWWPPLRYLLLVGLGALPLLALQLAQWKLFNGAWLLVPQGEGFMTWPAVYLDRVLFSPFRGLLAWMPVFFPALGGLLLLARRRPATTLPLLAVLLLDLWVNGSTPDWFAGGGYGPRRFMGELVIIGIGYAGFLAAFRPGWRQAVALAAGLALGVEQWVLLRYGLVEQIGGRVLSMAPGFNWEETDLPTFAAQVGRHVPDALLDPLDFFVLPGSPLHLWLVHGEFPGVHLAGLLLAGGLVALAFWLGGRWRQGWRRSVLVRQGSLAVGGLLCLLGVGWIVWLA